MATQFTPLVLQGTVYHSIGGSYDSRERAIEAVKAHHHNRHGGGGAFHVFEAKGGPDITLIEAAKSNDDPMTALALYKVVAQA